MNSVYFARSDSAFTFDVIAIQGCFAEFECWRFASLSELIQRLKIDSQHFTNLD